MSTIVQVVADGQPGGGTTAVLGLSRMLLEAHHTVHLIGEPDSYLLDEAASMGATPHPMRFGSRLRTPIISRQMAGLIKQISPEVVHAHGARAGLPLALALRQHGIVNRPRFAYTVHGFHYLAKPYPLKALGCLAEAMCITGADWVNFVSDADRQTAKRDGLLRLARTTTTIKNAVDVPAGLSDVTKRYDIGFLGRLMPQKNPLMLVEILKALRPASPTLSVIGGGDLSDELQQGLEQAGFSAQVTLLGSCRRDAALAHLAACRVLVLPSLWEGHPITLIEAMHLGVPVVASDIPGNDEIVVDGQSGFLVPVREATAYARRIDQLLQDEDLRQRMGEYARQVAATEYAPQRVLSKHLTHYGVAAKRKVSA